MISNEFHQICIVACLTAVPTQIHAQQQTSAAQVDALSVSKKIVTNQQPDLRAEFSKADGVVDYTKVEEPRSWYRQNITAIQMSTPVIGCAIGDSLAAGAGARWKMRAATCVAGAIGFSSIAPLMNPARELAKPSAELDALFASLPKRDAPSAVSVLSGSLDPSGRSSRQQNLARESEARGAEIAAMKERQRQNGSIWGQILLSAAVGYLAYEAGKGPSGSVLSSPSIIGGTGGGNSVTIQRRDANGQSQGQYEAPVGVLSPLPHGDGTIPNANKCITYKQTKTTANDFWFSVTNSCSFTVKVSYDVQDGQGFGTWGADIDPGGFAEYYARIGRIVTIFACPARNEEGKRVLIRGNTQQCAVS